MDRLLKASRMRQVPIIAVCWVFAFASIIGGVYLLTPWIIIDHPANSNTVYSAAASLVGIIIVAAAAIITGLMMIYGIRKNKNEWIARGLFYNLILRIYAQLVSFISFGFASANWISGLTLIFLVLIAYLVVRQQN